MKKEVLMTQQGLELMDVNDAEIEIDEKSPTVGRYVLHRQIARGGMATIHIARLMGDEGFSRIVAAKRLLPEFAEDSEFVAMFLDEARIASRCSHRNLVPVLDVVTTQDEVLLVQEYVHGAPLHHLLNKVRMAKERVPVPVAVSIACQVLAGLHAAHEMVDELGMQLNVVHRDVSPQNVMIATDGSARLLDFGVAKATMAAHVTREGTYKGKLAYSAPEQLSGKATRQSDLYSLGVLLWELLVGHRMHGSQSESELVATIMSGALPTITETLGAEHEWDAIDDSSWRQLSALEPIVRKGLVVDLASRWKTALEMEEALIAAVRPATISEVATWLKKHGKEYVEKQDRVIATEEASWRRKQPAMAAGTTSRRTPLAGSMRSGTFADGSTNRPIAPPAPMRRGPYLLVAILAMLVGGLTIGVVVLMKEDKPAAQPTTAEPAPQPARMEPPRVETPVMKPAEPPAAAKVDEPPTEAAKTDDELVKMEVKTVGPTTTDKDEPRAVKKTVVRQTPVKQAAKQQPRAKTVEIPGAPTPTPAAMPPAKGARDGSNAANCTPPYYFEGTKKIFKPECL